MTHHDGDTPTNGTDPDGTPTKHWFTEIPGLETPPRRRRVPLGDPDDDFDHYIPYFVEPPDGEREHEELVSRLIREGEALRTELSLPGFLSEDAPPSTSRTGTPEQPSADRADGTIPQAPPVHSDAPEAQHRTPRRRAPRRFRGRERKVSAPDWGTVVADASAGTDLRTVRLGLTTPLLMKCLGSVVRDAASEGVRRMVTRHKADLVLWFWVLYGSIVLAGNVAFSVPTWLSTGSFVLLPAAVAWWRHLREDLHEPGSDQNPAPHKDDQRT